MKESTEKKLLLIKETLVKHKREMDKIDFPGNFKEYRENINKEDFYRLIGFFNLLIEEIEKGKISEEKAELQTNKLGKHLDDYLKKIEKKQQAQKEYLKETAKDWWTLFHHGLALIAIVFGIVLGILNKNLITFVFIFFTALLVIKECEHVENFYHIRRRTNSYLFHYKTYTLVVTPLSIIWGLYLLMGLQAPFIAFFFILFMALLLSILFFFYQKQIEEDKEKEEGEKVKQNKERAKLYS
jgi:Flp pilus assembly protein TadB